MDAATIEETNRIRLSLGMKPLPVPGADASIDKAGLGTQEDTYDDREAKAQENYRKHLEMQASKRRREEKASAVRKARELAQRNLVLDGKGLGEADEGGDIDAKSWLMSQKKRQKKIDKARKLEEELAAAEAAAVAAVQYTSKDLAGIKVAHDMSTFLDGDGEQVLTLKDTTIDDNENEGDELENLSAREQEKLQEKLDLLKRRPGYNPMENDTSENGLLAQYDEEINGKKRKMFKLDEKALNADLADILSEPAQSDGRRIQAVNLDDLVGDVPVSSDYLDASEIKIKKPKKKKSKGTRQKQVDDDDLFPLNGAQENDSMMDVDTQNVATLSKSKIVSDTFVDDDELQASLATQRKNALKKRKRVRPEDIAKEVKEQDDSEVQEGTRDDDGGLVIGAVSEFVSGLSKPEEEEERKPKRRASPQKVVGSEEEDHIMEDHTGLREEETTQPQGDSAVDEEKTVGEGMGAALSLLRERGLVEQTEGTENYESFRDRQEFLAKKRMLEDELDEETRRQRERDRASGRLDRMSVREREEYARQQNTWRDQQQARRLAELFEANYKPNVKLQYTDDHGRSLDRKEAFKHMSHAFHGKGSGKGKTEKMFKKMDDEKRREAQSMFDASQSGGMSRATAQQLKKRKEAGVRLG